MATSTTFNTKTRDAIIDRYIAKQAITQALMNGRRISLKNSAEFKVSEMHTMICCIRKDITKKQLPYIMRDRWIDHNGRNIKEYWFEKRS